MTQHLKAWTRTRTVPTPLFMLPGRSEIRRDPYGVVVILSPWNYPLQLCLLPLIGAMAAGNCVILKPSKDAPATAQALQALINDAFEPDYIALLQGDRTISQALIQGECDFILFTGSPTVGREVMRMAADRLTPVALELGGKSPCLILPDADLHLAARRIAWAKTLNAGQTCVAPDYILVPRALQAPLLTALSQEAARQWQPDPLLNPDYPRIINQRHFQRLSAYLSDGRIAWGGRSDPAQRKLELTLLTDAPDHSPIMQDEIFGPILPLRPYDTLDEALTFLRQRPKPLALYLFTQNPHQAKPLLTALPSGGACINDCILHVSNSHLPFGGVGNSGFGQYHGRHSIQCFTRPRGVYHGSQVDLPVRYPPYGGKLGLLQRFLK